MEAAFALAAKTGITSYDACYAVLAHRLANPLVTAEAPLCRVIAWAVWLGDLQGCLNLLWPGDLELKAE
jgi:predicted nucleic acid-binding protein